MVLAQFQRNWDEWYLKKAIETNDRATMAESLRRLADEKITPDIINKLADYLDPAIENPLYKCGPKPKKKRLFVERHSIAGFYKCLCENREFIRYILNREKEAFSLTDNSEPFDADGNFAPQWKYPHSERKRKLVSLPKKAEIKTLVCEVYSINSRTLDDFFAEYNKK